MTEQEKMQKAEEAIEAFIDEFRGLMEGLASDERKILLDRMLIGYCRDCWTETRGRQCHCTNDE